MFLPYRTRLQITKTTISSPLAPFSSMSSSEDISNTHTKKEFYFEIKPRGSLKDLTGLNRH